VRRSSRAAAFIALMSAGSALKTIGFMWFLFVMMAQVLLSNTRSVKGKMKAEANIL